MHDISTDFSSYSTTELAEILHIKDARFDAEITIAEASHIIYRILQTGFADLVAEYNNNPQESPLNEKEYQAAIRILEAMSQTID